MRKLSVIILGISLILLVLYDIVALALGGVKATFSDILTEWSFTAHPLLLISFGSILGGLLVHWFWVDEIPKYKESFCNDWLSEDYGFYGSRVEQIDPGSISFVKQAFKDGFIKGGTPVKRTRGEKQNADTNA